MKLNIQNSQLLIGAKLLSEQAINLPLVAPDQSAFTVNNTSYVGCFISLPEEVSTQDKASRCIGLIKALLKQVEQSGTYFPIDTPIFWLLPEFNETLVTTPDVNTSQENASHANASDDNRTKNVARFGKQLQAALPSLFNHPQSQFFPFGRAAFPIALAAVEAVFEQHDIDTITFISVDSLLHQLPQLIADNALVTANSEQGIIPSEGAIFCQVSRADDGISVDFVQSMIAPVKQRTQTVQQLFDQSITCLAAANEQQNNASVLSHLYLPGNGNETLQQSWLDAYVQLSGHVDIDTSICQSALFTGELGSMTGLYNFLHIANGYENHFLQGNVLQLEVSDSLHQGIALYSWASA